MLQDQDPKMQPMVFRRSRAQVATSILKDLEQLGNMQSKNEIGFGGDWIEESVNLENMELFEELSEVAYIPDSPVMSFDDLPPHSPITPVSSPSHLSEQSILHTQGLQEPHTLSSAYEPGDFDQLKADFEAILESLPTDSSSFGDVIDILGIPTTLVGDEEMISLDFADDVANDMGIEMEMEISSEDDASVLLVNEKDVFQIEGNERNTVTGSYNYESYMASSPENCVSEDDDDVQANTAEKILDALLQGNLQVAESYIPVEVKQVESRIVPLSIEDDSSRSSSVSEVQTVVVAKNKRSPPKTEEIKSPKKAKTERRGRKSGSNKKSMAHLTDKALRKKEQNKTAATRYRQKKKLETNSTLQTEHSLQLEHDDLAKQKEDLHRQILMIKQLLREVVIAKKSQVRKRVSTNRRKL